MKQKEEKEEEEKDDTIYQLPIKEFKRSGTDVKVKDKPEQPKFERIITMLGHSKDDDNGESCGNCVEEKQILEQIKNTNPSIKIEEIDYYSNEGQKIAKEKKIDYMPHTTDCPVDATTGKVKDSECVQIKGYDKNYFSKYLNKKEEGGHK